MKKIAAFIVILALLGGCKKAIENRQEDLVLKAMTDGQWVITSFTQNGANITSDFSSYKFKYYSNKTVDAINNGTVEKTGSWDGNANTLTITANFTNATYPLTLINGGWHIDNNSWTFVVASQNAGAETKSLRLEKL
jgi:hypothetical protein